MNRNLLGVGLPALILVALILLSVSISGGGCLPPATCSGTELGPLNSLLALIEDPSTAVRGVWLILAMLTMSWAAGTILTAILYGAVVWWLVSAIRKTVRRTRSPHD